MVMFKDVDKPEMIKGLKVWRNNNNKFYIAMLHYTADPERDPDRDGKEWFENERAGVPLADWNKEYEIDFSSRAGKLIFGSEFCDFDPQVHFINSFEIEKAQYLLSLDFGQTNPTSAHVGAWTPNNVLYIIDEYYKPALPSVSSREMFKQFAYLMSDDPDFVAKTTIRQKRIAADITFQIKVIDPSTAAKNRTKMKDGEEMPYSVHEDFYDNGWDFELGNNDVQAGITRIREYMQLDSNGKAHLYIFKDKCPNLCLEILNYRYKKLTELQAKSKNESEEPVKKNDHAIDDVRYQIMTRPFNPREPEKPKTRIQRDIESLIRPKILNNFDDDSAN